MSSPHNPPGRRSCAAHSDRAAEYVCADCRRALCGECVEEGHRLLFCRLCGEQALPLVEEAPASVPERVLARRRSAAYSLSDALAYPFRGHGPYLYGGYVALLTLLGLLSTVGAMGCVSLVVQVLILVLIPGFLFAIVRSTERGDTEPPDWPDWSETGERAREWIGFLLILVIGLLPSVLLLRTFSCGLGRVLAGGWGASCWLALLAGTAIGLVMMVPAFGAVGIFYSNGLALRVDLHVRALAALGPAGWAPIGLAFGVFVLSQLAQTLFMAVPLIGLAVSSAAAAYGLLVTPHLVGVAFRRHSHALRRIYTGT